MRRIQIYDTTLRDGTQGEGVSLSLEDKLQITRRLDEIGIDFIEGGYPLSNEKDAEYFRRVRELPLKHAKICAFGMTRRKGVMAQDDPGMRALFDSQAPVCTIVGKTWDLHVLEVLRVSLEENLEMIRDSITYLVRSGREVIYDAEHCFDGWKANPGYAKRTLLAAAEAGAKLVGSAGASIHDIVAQVDRVATLMQEINETTSRQREGFTQINGAVCTLDAATQQNAALVEQGAAASESLRQQADQLRSAVAVFQV